MASETTAAQAGAVGVVRRDPMAMLPFCGYNMGDYWQHWLDIGDKITKHPKIFNVNWFRLDDEGHFIWPGYGENFRVIDWIIRRCKDEVGAKETAIGFVPNPGDIDISDLDYHITPDRKFDNAALGEILTVDSGYWKDDVASIKEFYSQFGDKLPKVLADELAGLAARLG